MSTDAMHAVNALNQAFLQHHPVAAQHAANRMSVEDLTELLVTQPVAEMVTLWDGLMLDMAGAVLQRLLRRRKAQFADQLPESLEQLAGSLRAGLSVEQGVETLARESLPPLSEEFGLVVAEMRLGVPMVEALERLNGRVGGGDLELAVDAISVSREVGGSLSDTIDELVRTVRERRRVEGRLRALTAQGRMQGWVVGLLPVALAGLLMALEPEITRDFFTSRTGMVAVGAGLALEAVAIVWIRRIMRLEV